MAILLIIFQIISAIPTLIKVITTIIDLINGLKGSNREEAEQEFHGILRRHRRCHDNDTCEAELNAFRDKLKAKSGPQA